MSGCELKHKKKIHIIASVEATLVVADWLHTSQADWQGLHHWLLAVSPNWPVNNPSRDRWESYQWLKVRQRFLLRGLFSNTVHWLVIILLQYGSKGDYINKIWNSKCTWPFQIWFFWGEIVFGAVPIDCLEPLGPALMAKWSKGLNLTTEGLPWWPSGLMYYHC